MRLTVAIALCLLGGLVLTVGAFARESSITWTGSTGCTSRNHFCHERRATVRLLLSGSLATATFEGYSEASHDAEPTRATHPKHIRASQHRAHAREERTEGPRGEGLKAPFV